jgi:hypothetical protein
VLDDNKLVIQVITLSELIKPEVISNERLDKFPKNNLTVNAMKCWTSDNKAFFNPDKIEEIPQQQTQEAAPKRGSKAAAIADGPWQVGIEFGGQLEQQQRTEGENANARCAKIVAGWAAYQNSKRAPLLSSATLQVLKQLFDLGRTDISKQISADCAHVIVMEQVAARNW